MSNSNQALVEHVLNKYAPYAVLLFSLIMGMGLKDLNLYICLGAVIFIDKYAFFVGRSMGEYENNERFKKQVDETLED